MEVIAKLKQRKRKKESTKDNEFLSLLSTKEHTNVDKNLERRNL